MSNRTVLTYEVKALSFEYVNQHLLGEIDDHSLNIEVYLYKTTRHKPINRRSAPQHPKRNNAACEHSRPEATGKSFITEVMFEQNRESLRPLVAVAKARLARRAWAQG